MFLYILLFLISCFVLVKASAFLVPVLVKIARSWHLSEFAVSFLLLALAASLPEIFIAISAGLRQVPEISLANIIGANVAKLSLVVGLLVIMGGAMVLPKRVARQDSGLVGMVILLALILMLDRHFSRLEAGLMILVFVFYAWYLLTRARAFSLEPLNGQLKNFPGGWLKISASFLLGVALVFLSAQVIILSLEKIAAGFNLTPFLISIVLLGLGTTLPEFIFGWQAIKAGHSSMAVGNLMGSVVINSSLVLGILGLAYPFTLANSGWQQLNGFLFIIATALLFVLLAKSNDKITKKEAWLLIGVYGLFVAMQIIS